MSVRDFNYGQSSGHTWFAVLFVGSFAAVLIVSLFYQAGEGPQGRVVLLHKPWDWIVAAIALLFLGLAALGLREVRTADDNRRNTLALTGSGIDYRPKGRLGRPVFIAFSDVINADVVSEDGNEELRIKHSGGRATFHRNCFDDRASFEAFATIVAERGRGRRKAFFSW